MRTPAPPTSAILDADGRYEDRWLVGRGGMGEVRLVYDRRLRRTAVMKIVRPELAGTRAARRLAVEAEITARLQHPGVVPVYDAGRLPDGRPFYVMREIRGQTLAEVVEAVHRASPPGEWRAADGWTFRRLVDALRRVCETVAYAHAQGVVHRDLKPANVMLEGLGAVLVLDWGIAKRVETPAAGLGGAQLGGGFGGTGLCGGLGGEERAAAGSAVAAPGSAAAGSAAAGTLALEQGPGGDGVGRGVEVAAVDDADAFGAAGTIADDEEMGGPGGRGRDAVPPFEGLHDGEADAIAGLGARAAPAPAEEPARAAADGGREERVPQRAPGTQVFLPPVDAPRDWSAGTAIGAVLGTRGFMAPEQARGEPLGPAADVYALGATLHVLLFGALPEAGTAAPRASAVSADARGAYADPRVPDPRTSTPRSDPRAHDPRAHDPRAHDPRGHAPAPKADPRLPDPRTTDPRVPDALVRLAGRAMAPAACDRPTAAELATEIGGWLDGVRRREEALVLVDEADALRPAILADRARAASLREEARRRLAQVPAHAPADAKVEAWRLEDEADELLTHAVAREEAWTQLLHAALQIVDVPEAHARLADHYRERHAAAEAARDRAAATRAELRLRAHDRGRHAGWLRGDATLTLTTVPPGATVTLHRYVLRDRVLVPERVGVLGRTPLTRAPIPWGSLLLRVDGPGGVVDLPILVGRAEDWQLAPPDRAPLPLRLPRPGDLGPDDVYVPAGWFRAGGDPHAGDVLPAGPRWLEGFVIRRFPVTNAEYLAFLDDLVAAGRVEEAEARAPRRGEGVEQETGDCFYGRRPDGGFCLANTGPGADWALDEPVTSVSWHDAAAFAAWEAARTDQPWRLPHELEWEKAARGADGRFLPWGDFFEPSWANNLEGVLRPPRRMPVDSFPADTSPYGVRGMAGNVRDWCANAWREGAAPGAPDVFVAVRGGAFSGNRNNCRLALRFAAPPGRRFTLCGFRLARTTAS